MEKLEPKDLAQAVTKAAAILVSVVDPHDTETLDVLETIDAEHGIDRGEVEGRLVFVSEHVVEQFSIRQSEDDGRECPIEQSILDLRNESQHYTLSDAQIAVVKEEAEHRLGIARMCEPDDASYAEELRDVRRTLKSIRD